MPITIIPPAPAWEPPGQSAGGGGFSFWDAIQQQQLRQAQMERERAQTARLEAETRGLLPVAEARELDVAAEKRRIEQERQEILAMLKNRDYRLDVPEQPGMMTVAAPEGVDTGGLPVAPAGIVPKQLSPFDPESLPAYQTDPEYAQAIAQQNRQFAIEKLERGEPVESIAAVGFNAVPILRAHSQRARVGAQAGLGLPTDIETAERLKQIAAFNQEKYESAMEGARLSLENAQIQAERNKLASDRIADTLVRDNDLLRAQAGASVPPETPIKIREWLGQVEKTQNAIRAVDLDIENLERRSAGNPSAQAQLEIYKADRERLRRDIGSTVGDAQAALSDMSRTLATRNNLFGPPPKRDPDVTGGVDEGMGATSKPPGEPIPQEQTTPSGRWKRPMWNTDTEKRDALQTATDLSMSTGSEANPSTRARFLKDLGIPPRGASQDEKDEWGAALRQTIPPLQIPAIVRAAEEYWGASVSARPTERREEPSTRRRISPRGGFYGSEIPEEPAPAPTRRVSPRGGFY